MNKAKKSTLFLLLVVALLAIPTLVVFAKELGMLTISGPGIKGELTLKNDFVLALTGYHPDLDFLRKVGVQIGDPPDCRPAVHPDTLETNVPGIYLAGVVVAGNRTNEIFIENGRFHGREIAIDLKRKLSGLQIPTLEQSTVKGSAGKLQSAE